MSHGLLILPHGLQRKSVAPIRAEEMAWLATAEDVLHNLQMSIICNRCKTPISGQNDPIDATMRVDCQCRTLTYQVKADS